MKNTLKTVSIFLFCGLLLCLTGCKKENIFEGAQDIGDVKLPGSYTFDATQGIYTLNAAGINLWNEADAFFMTWKKVTGDFSMSADIAFEGQGVNEHRKMGIIIREKLTAGSRYADVAVHGDGLTSLQYRAIENDVTQEVVSTNTHPTSIYLERKGNTISIKTGNGSLPANTDAEIAIEFPETCYVGLFMCSHEDTIMETGYFRNVIFIK